MSDIERAAWVEIDLAALRRNTERLVALVAPAQVCTIVKADAYGHGAVEVSRATLAGGATRLGVLYFEEAMELREAGIDAPLLVMSEIPSGALELAVENRMTPTVYTREGVHALATVLKKRAMTGYPVHVKIDTGMNRLGVRPPQAIALMQEIQNRGELLVEGVFTHFAVSDEVDNPFTRMQGEHFVEVLKEAADAGISPPLIHCSNSAAAILYPDLRFSFVRFGVAVYGMIDAAGVPLPDDIEPVMSVRAKVAAIKQVDAGEAISYGQRYRVDRPTCIATLPLGYADGVPRALYAGGGEVLIGGKRRLIAGTVSMGLITVDCGDDDIRPGDDAVLIGQQDSERITAADWARWTDSIEREITCRAGATLPRKYHSGR
jgi:alanine racemase